MLANNCVTVANSVLLCANCDDNSLSLEVFRDKISVPYGHLHGSLKTVFHISVILWFQRVGQYIFEA